MRQVNSSGEHSVSVEGEMKERGGWEERGEGREGRKCEVIKRPLVTTLILHSTHWHVKFTDLSGLSCSGLLWCLTCIEVYTTILK